MPPKRFTKPRFAHLHRGDGIQRHEATSKGFPDTSAAHVIETGLLKAFLGPLLPPPKKMFYGGRTVNEVQL